MVGVYVIHSRMIMDKEDHISDKIGSTIKSRSVSGFPADFGNVFCAVNAVEEVGVWMR